MPTLLVILAVTVRGGEHVAGLREVGQAALQHGAEVLGPPVPGVPIEVDLRRLPTVSSWDPGTPLADSQRRDDGSGQPVETPPVLDPLVERQRAWDGPGPIVIEVHNVLGTFSAWSPNDPTGDVGADYFVQAVRGGLATGSSLIAVYDKGTGDRVLGPFVLETLAPSGPCTSGLGDPIVLYDHLAGRWFLSEIANTGDRMCIYTSRTADPIAGGWCFYEFQDDTFPDYPKYGVWSTMYTATTNKGGAGPDVYAFDRANMLSPNGVSCPTARPTQRFANAPNLPGLGFEAFTPVDLDGPAPPPGTPAYFVRHRDEELHGDPAPSPTLDRVELWALAVDFGNPANSTFTKQPDLLLSEFDSNLCPPLGIFECVPQPDGGPDLDPLLEVVMQRATYRRFGDHETILGVLQTDVNDFPDHSGERWFEARRSGGGPFTLFQNGTYSPDAEHRFMGMTAMDGSGNILLAYNVSSESVYPSLRYTGRLATDPLGVMTVPETTLAAGNAVNNSNRYGDYNQMGVDPVDDCTFWLVGTYNLMATNSRRVQIGAIRFEACGEALIFSDGFESGDTSAWDTVMTD